jgi:glycosyl transferase family 92
MERNRSPGGQYLSVCAIYRDEAPYLREWVAFHRLVGVDRFYLYNNRSSDGHLEALAPYLDSGVVELRDWPLYPGQVAAYEDCLKQHREDSRWIAFLDVDEFLFSPTGRPLPDVLAEYEGWPGVAVNRAVFGTSGHRKPPEGLVIESYVRRASNRNSPTPIKSVVDPRRVERCDSCHVFIYRDGLAVDENKRLVDKPYAKTDSIYHSILRVNHYWTKSEEECLRKFAKPTAFGRLRRGAAHERALGGSLDEELDETITRYVPALREALAGEAAAESDDVAVGGVG